MACNVTNVYSPVAFNALRRRYIQITAAVCAISFVVTQTSLLSWCPPTQLGNSQCITYHNHAIVSLLFDTLTTVLVLILPTPLIPTPRRCLLIILMVTGISTLIVGVFARVFVLKAPNSHTYLFYYIYEMTLLIVFANLPFLTSLVVSTAPARIRDFGRNISFSREGVHMPLSPWPRSNRVSVQEIGAPPLRSSRFGSTASITIVEAERKERTSSAPVTRPTSTNYTLNVIIQSDGGRGWPS